MIYDAVIIGGGPAGGTAAMLLARYGWSVALVEKDAFPRRKVCGEFMSATNAPLWEELGLKPLMDRSGGPEIQRVALFARDAVVEAAMPRVRSQGSGWGQALGRDVLDTALLQGAADAGVALYQPWTAVSMTQDTGHSQIHIKRKGVRQILRARVVVAAHGSWTGGQLPTQISRPHRSSDLLGFKAYFEGSALPDDVMALLVFPGGYGGMVAHAGGTTGLSCCIRRDALEHVRRRVGGGSATTALLSHMMATCRGVADVLREARWDAGWLAAGPLNPGIRPRFGNGFFRIGNAAGEAHPVVAEGVSMALQSGWLLARHLRAASPASDLGPIARAFSADWARHFAPRIRMASAVAAVAMRPTAVVALLPAVKAIPSLLTFGAALSGKTNTGAVRF